MFSVMWSEHCSYKSSKPLLADAADRGRGRRRRARARTPASSRSATASPSRSRSSRTTTRRRSSRTRAPRPASAASCATSSRWAPGRSPSSTRCASATRPTPRTRHLVDGVVRGVGGYGNCVGVPTVGGELVFDPTLPGQPAGQRHGHRPARGATPDARRGARARATSSSCSARRPAATASAARRSSPAPRSPTTTRPSGRRVQVGDPFAEKLLIEASLELIERGLVEGLQDLGAGGITCATSETADRAGTGIARRPRRDPAARARHGAVRGDDLRVAGADVRGRPAGPLGGRPRGLRALGPAGRGHRPGHRRRRHRRRRGRPRRRRAAAARCARARPDPGRARSPATRSSTTGSRAAPTHRRGAPAPGAPAQPSATGCRSAAWTRAPSCWPCSARRTWPRATRSSSSTTRRSVRTPSPGRAAAPPSCGSRARPRRSSPRPTATRRVGALDPWLGAALSVAEATRNVSITGRAAARRHQLPQLRRPDPARGVLAADRRASAASGDACRALGLPVTGGNVSLYNESPAGAIAPDAGDRRRRPARRRRDAGRPGLRARRTTRSCSSARPAPGLAGSAYAALAGRRARGRPAGPRSRARGARSRRSSARPSRAASSPRPRTSPAAAWPSRSPSARCGAASGRSVRLAVASSPAVDLFGESPSRLVVTLPAALRARRSSCWPASTACRSRRIGTVGGDRLVIELAGAGATGRRRGAREPRRRRARGPASRTCGTPGTTGSAAPSAGRADPMCGVFGAVLPGGEADGRRRRSRRSACSRSSTAARSRPGSPSATASS